MTRTLVFAAALAGMAAPPVAHAATTIQFFPHLAPARVDADFDQAASPSDYFESPSYAAYAANAIGAILDGDPNRGGSINDTPTAFETLTRTTLSPWELIATEFPNWRGDFTPSGAFAAEQGTIWRLGARIESDIAFTLADVRRDYADSFDPDSQLLSESPGRFAPDLAVGIWYGADGAPGGGDDLTCDSAACDPATQPLNRFAWLGVGKFTYITEEGLTDFYGGDLEAFRADWEAFLLSDLYGIDPPFFMEYAYTVTVDGTVLATADYRATVAPVPASGALALFGLGAVLAVRRRGT